MKVVDSMGTVTPPPPIATKLSVKANMSFYFMDNSHTTRILNFSSRLFIKLCCDILGMDMKSEYLNYPNTRVSKSGFESNSYPDIPNYSDYPNLWICFLCDNRLTVIFNV